MGLREDKKAATRLLIERAALELFAEHGYGPTTMGDVANAAGVSLRTVAVHFPTKPDLILAAEEEFVCDVIDVIERRPSGQSTLDAMQGFINAVLQGLPERPQSEQELIALRRVVLAAEPSIRELARGKVARIDPVLRTQMARDLGVEEDDIRAALVAGGASGVFAALESWDFGEKHELVASR